MTETEAHRAHVGLVHLVREQRRELRPDAAEQVERGRVGHDVDRQLLGDRPAELGVRHDQRLGRRRRRRPRRALALALHLVHQERLERLGQLAVGDGRHVLDRRRRRREPVDRLQLEQVARLGRRVELLVQLGVAQLARVRHAEQRIADRRLEEDEHPAAVAARARSEGRCGAVLSACVDRTRSVEREKSVTRRADLTARLRS